MKRLLWKDSHCLLIKDSMNTIGFLNMGQKNIQCIDGMYLKKAKINVENFSEFPVTLCLFLPVVLGINGIIASTFIA